jgi:MFS family permease
MRGTPGFEYQPAPGSFLNWYVTLDLVCENPTAYNGMASFYFIGYIIGAVFFWIPDSIGRRTTMNLFMPVYLLASGMVIFRNDISMKILGFFI